MDETNRRRKLQMEYNLHHGITPVTIRKDVRSVIDGIDRSDSGQGLSKESIKKMGKREVQELMARLEREMKAAAKALEFEEAARIRDVLMELRTTM